MSNSRQIVLRPVFLPKVESFQSMKQLTSSIFTTRIARVLAAGALLMASSNAMAANLVQNGSFESNAGVGQINSGTTLSNWSVGSANGHNPAFAFVADKNADSTGFGGIDSGPVKIFGPNTPTGLPPVGPVANGFDGAADGTYFLVSSPSFANAPISQTINGLKAGDQYTLSFQYAGAQATGGFGPQSEGWHVTLGGDVNENTGNTLGGDLNNASLGFTGWHTFTYDFYASTSSETLSFLANGTADSALQPASLLDNVSLIDNSTPPPPAVPEPSTIVLLGTSLLCIGAARTLRKKN